MSEPSTTNAGKRSSLALLLTTSVVSSLIMLDSNVVAVSLPAIGRSLHAGFTDVQWVISAYVVTYAALLLAAGNFADLYGRKKATVIGLVIFGLASAACGLASSSLLLNVSRAIQGIGGALLLTSSLAILSHAFIGAARQHALAFWGASLGIALAAGPIIGGAITDFFGWRWVFLVNLPICVVLVVSTFRVIEESHDPDARSLDWAGIATFSLALAVMIWALIDGNDAGWTSQTIAVRLVVAAILFAAFAVAELRQKHPMVDFGLFRHRTFLGGVLAMIGYGASAQVMVFFLPVFLQNAYGFSPFAAGVAMIPFAMPMVLALKFVPPLASRYSGRILLSAGLATTLVGNVLFWYVASAGRSYAYFVVSMVIAGIGAGLLNGQTVKVLQGAVPEERAGMASGIASTTRFIGILVAVAALGAVLGNVARDAFSAAAIAFGLGPEAAATGAKGVISGDLEGVVRTVPNAIRTQIHDAGLHAYAHGFAAATVIAAAVAAIAAVVTFLTVSERETAPSANQAQQLVGD